jgi:hypothetical protein
LITDTEQACNDASDENIHDKDAIIQRDNTLQPKLEEFHGANKLKGKQKQRLRLKWKVYPG